MRVGLPASTRTEVAHRLKPESSIPMTCVPSWTFGIVSGVCPTIWPSSETSAPAGRDSISIEPSRARKDVATGTRGSTGAPAGSRSDADCAGCGRADGACGATGNSRAGSGAADSGVRFTASLPGDAAPATGGSGTVRGAGVLSGGAVTDGVVSRWALI